MSAHGLWPVCSSVMGQKSNRQEGQRSQMDRLQVSDVLSLLKREELLMIYLSFYKLRGFS